MPKAQKQLPDDRLTIETTSDVLDPHPVGTRTPFQFDGDDRIMWATRPKTILLMEVSAQLDAMDYTSADARLYAEIEKFLTLTMDEDDRQHIWTRLLDPDDTLDSSHVLDLTTQLQVLWFARPTRKAKAGAISPRPGGRSSTGTAPSGG